MMKMVVKNYDSVEVQKREIILVGTPFRPWLNKESNDGKNVIAAAFYILCAKQRQCVKF